MSEFQLEELFITFSSTNLALLSISQMHSSLLALESALNAECIRFNLFVEFKILADIAKMTKSEKFI